LANDHGKTQLPDILVQSTNPALREQLERLKATMIEAEARQAAKEIHKELEGWVGGHDKPWLPICPMPTDLCRVSPFFPMDKASLNLRDYLEGMVITETSWGRISYYGPRLSTYEEDVLMAILALLDDKGNRKETLVDGAKTYTYRGSLLPILRMMGLTDQGKNYARIKASLRRLTTAALEMEIFKRSKTGKRKVTKSDMTSLLARFRWDEELQELTVTVNPYFFETYIQGGVTRLDVIRRAELRSPIAKALYRFIQSHRDDHWQGHFLTLASTLNLEETLPNFRKRDRIRTAVRRLIAAKLLTKASGFKKIAPNVVTLIRSKESHTKRKTITQDCSGL